MTAPTPADALIHELLSTASRKLPLAELLGALADRLVERGVEVQRIRTSVTTKHPEVFVRSLIWQRGKATAIQDTPHQILATPAFLENPVKEIRDGTQEIRCRLRGEGANLSYVICKELATEGFTDYVIYGLDFSSSERTYISFATQAPEGFSESNLALFSSLLPVLSTIIEIESKAYALTSLLNVYLGHNAAARVLSGSFLRGTGQSIEAAVWFCDMRDFTSFTNANTAASVVSALDRFFEAAASPIASHGGEILKFIGDAVLAIFPVGTGTRAAACDRALQAAKAAYRNVQSANKDGHLLNIELGISLHIGDIMYGNIGTKDRLDFTAIGAAVNEVCRVESLCRTLGPILMTAEFAAHFPDQVVSQGMHELKGIAGTKEIFALRQ